MSKVVGSPKIRKKVEKTRGPEKLSGYKRTPSPKKNTEGTPGLDEGLILC